MGKRLKKMEDSQVLKEGMLESTFLLFSLFHGGFGTPSNRPSVHPEIAPPRIDCSSWMKRPQAREKPG